MEVSISQKGWVVSKLEDIALRITKGGTPTTYGFSFKRSGINFLKVENIKNGRISVNSITDFIGEDAHAFQEKSQLEDNDILFSIAGTIGTICIVKKEHLPANTNQALAIIKGSGCAIVPSLLGLQLESFVQKIKTKARGGAMNNVSLNDLKNLLVYIPPLPEQHRIVAKIEELFTNLDKGIESLKTAQQQLKIYRQAVLKWAFEGKLTNKGVKEGELPEGWKWVRIDEAADSLDNLRKPINKAERSKRHGNVPYYGANGRTGWIDDYLFDEPLILVVEDETFTGREQPFSYKITGKSWVNNHAHILRSKVNVDMDFLNYQLFYYPFLQLTTGTTGRKKLTKGALMKAEIKICSLTEQLSIVAEIESRLSVCDKIEESISQSLQQAEALRQSILKKAFEGTLVPQDPNDEPASLLLARIRAEREAAGKAKPVKTEKVKKVKRGPEIGEQLKLL